jgi:hypothetical protein
LPLGVADRVAPDTAVNPDGLPPLFSLQDATLRTWPSVPELRTLRELIDALVTLASHSGHGVLSGPDYTRLLELDAKIGSECQLRSIEIPRLGESPTHGQIYFGFTRVPCFQDMTTGGLLLTPGTGWQQAMRGLKFMADKTEPKPLAAPVEPVISNGRADQEVDANTRKLFPKGIPDNQDVVDLVVRLNTEMGPGRSMNQIAREFTGETAQNDAKALSLLSQIRRMIRKGRVKL